MKAKLYKISYAAILIAVFTGCYFLFDHFKKQSDLDSYFSDKLEHCHYTMLHPWRRLTTESMRDHAIGEWMRLKDQMLQDGYTRAEIEKIDSKAFKKIQKEFNSINDKRWKEMEDNILNQRQ